MREALKKLIEEMGGTVLLDGAIVQFSERSFEQAFRHIFDAGMDYQKQTDNESESSGGPHGRH